MGSFLNAIVAQLVECRPSKANVEGSSPFYRSKSKESYRNYFYFLLGLKKIDSCYMVIVVQLVRMSDCGSEGRQFEPDQSPK